MNIQIEPHTLQRAKERGTTQEEIIKTLTKGENIEGKDGRPGSINFFLLIKYGMKGFMNKRNAKSIIQLRLNHNNNNCLFLGNFGINFENL